jgi:hypothetical protein
VGSRAHRLKNHTKTKQKAKKGRKRTRRTSFFFFLS